MTVTLFIVACSNAHHHPLGQAGNSVENPPRTLRKMTASCCQKRIGSKLLLSRDPLSVTSTFVSQMQCIYVLASVIQPRCVPVMYYCNGREDAM